MTLNQPNFIIQEENKVRNKKPSKSYESWISEKFKALNVEPSDTGPAPTDIAGLFIPLVKYLRLLGFCPFTISHGAEGQSNSVVYTFKWASPAFFYCLLVSIPFGIYTISVTLYFVWFGFTKEFCEVLEFQGIFINNVPKNISTVSELGTRLVPSTFPMFTVVSVVGTMASQPTLLRVLNQWSVFQREFFAKFPKAKDPFATLKRYRNRTLGVFPVIGFLAVVVVVVVMSNCDHWKGCIILPKGLPVFAATFTMTLMIGGHGTHFLMYGTLREAFVQIRLGITKYHVGNTEADLKALHKATKRWTDIILLARKQVKLTSKAGAVHHGLALFINFIYLCLGVFGIASSSSKLGYVGLNRAYILLMFSGWGFSILSIKALMCEKITEQEKLIVDQLRKVEAKDYVPAMIQINSLIDLIVREPAAIRFWNVVTFNKSFLVQLIGQVATYLIVLIQFDNMG